MSRHQNAGQIVQTRSGKLGIIYNRDAKALNDPAGRVPVTLVDENYQPILIDGEPQRILTNPANCRVIGFQD